MKIITAEARDSIVSRDDALRVWLGKRHSYHPSELPPHLNPPTNDERAQVEIYNFMTNPPERYFAYPSNDGTGITNWTGISLGAASFGRSWRGNMRDERQSFTLKAINGKTYHGTVYGTYCRMKIAKGKK